MKTTVDTFNSDHGTDQGAGLCRWCLYEQKEIEINCQILDINKPASASLFIVCQPPQRILFAGNSSGPPSLSCSSLWWERYHNSNTQNIMDIFRGAISQRYQDEEIARTREEGCSSCRGGRVAVRGVRAASGGGDTRALRTRVLPRVLVCRQVALSFITPKQ